MSLLNLPLKYEERVIFQLRQLYQQFGYTQYRMSKFEEYELYARNKNFLVSEHILTFTDTDGKLLALKPDVTLSIIKNSDCKDSLEKVYYNENVYRTAPTSHGYREIMQVGLECIGNLDLYAMSEVVELAARSLQIIHKDYLLDLSHMGIVSGLLDAMGWSEHKIILDLIKEKNTPAIKVLCQDANIDSGYIKLLCELIELYGTPAQILPILDAMTLNTQMSDALCKLHQICDLLEPYQSNLRLDFSIVNDMNYYNGIIFRGYLPGLASGVLAGGQYDNLVQRMGKSTQAIGFAVYLDQLERFEQAEKDFDVDVLLLYQEDTPAKHIKAVAEELRRNGNTVRIDRCIPNGLRFRNCKEVN